MKLAYLPKGRVLLWCAWICPAFLTVPAASSFPDAIARALVAAGSAGVIAFLPRPLWKVSCVATAVALPFTVWWCGYAALGGSGPGYDAAVAALQTDRTEVLGALKFVSSRPSFVIAFGGHLLFLLWACRGAFARELGRTTSAERPVYIALFASSLSLILVALLAELAPPSGHRYAALPPGNDPFTYQPESTPHPLFGPATLASPLGSAEEIASMKFRLRIWNREHGYHRVVARAPRTVTKPILAIFFLGESARADSYGPSQRGRGLASRQLAERIDAGLGSWLPTACASSDGTHMAAPMLLTATTPENIRQTASAPTILGILKAAGFSTAWLANNQAGPDGMERGHDLYAGVFNVNPDDLYGEKLQHWRVDADMVPAAKSFASAVAAPKAMIMHAIGSHFPYEWRYPADFFPGEPANLGADGRIELRYARSLEYGARIVLDVAALLDATTAPAFLIYTSDHGENLPSDRNGLQGHLAPRTSIEDGTVPAFVLWNKAMADTGKPARILARILAARQIAHADVSKVFLALAGMSDQPVEPTADPSIWGRVSVGDEYGVVACADLKP